MCVEENTQLKYTLYYFLSLCFQFFTMMSIEKREFFFYTLGDVNIITLLYLTPEEFVWWRKI